MRIAVVTTSYPSYEGDPAGHFVEAEVHELEAAGHEVRVFRPKAGGAFGWPGAPTRIREKPSRLLEVGTWTARASVELRRYQPDRVIAHWCMPCAFPIALSTSSDVEIEVVSHGGDIRLLCGLPPRARDAITQKLLARVTRWRFVSEHLRTSLESSLSRKEDQNALRAASEVVPGALHVPDVRDDARAKRSALAGRRLYVCAGRLVASKRIDKVIDYVASAEDRRERLLVVLGEGPERPHLERLARAWQLDARFLGKTNRLETLGWIGAADELVHASRLEGLSTVVREAEQLGVPVTILS